MQAEVVTNSVEVFPWKKRRKMASQVASGMQFLHEQSVAHRDLKSLNVLVAADHTAKVSDFGQSRDDSAAEIDSTRQGHLYGTSWWNAPEYGSSEFSEHVDFFKADVWSFAAICWELLTLRRPQAEYGQQMPAARTHPQLLLLALADEKLRLQLSAAELAAAESLDEDAKALHGVMKATMLRSPMERPDFSAVVARLSQKRGPGSPKVKPAASPRQMLAQLSLSAAAEGGSEASRAADVPGSGARQSPRQRSPVLVSK